MDSRFIQKEVDLKKRMRHLKIFQKDIKETFVRSSGPGGQNINKVSTCVILKHIPTEIQVKCQSERTQGLNRYRARYLLVAKIEKQRKAEKERAIQQVEKKKRQNRKRPKFLKERILQGKHKQSEKKSSRRKICSRDVDKDI